MLRMSKPMLKKQISGFFKKSTFEFIQVLCEMYFLRSNTCTNKQNNKQTEAHANFSELPKLFIMFT